MGIKALSIDKIGLSVRSVNALHNNNIYTIGDILTYKKSDLRKLRNIGDKSTQEILEKIQKYQKLLASNNISQKTQNNEHSCLPTDYKAWFSEEIGKNFIRNWLEENQVHIEVLEHLSAKSHDLLISSGYTKIHQIVFLTIDELLSISNMDLASAEEITTQVDNFLKEQENSVLEAYQKKLSPSLSSAEISIFDIISISQYQKTILEYVILNDVKLDSLAIKDRTKNALARNKLRYISQIIFNTKDDLAKLPNISKVMADDIIKSLNIYLKQHEKNLIEFCNNNKLLVLDDDAICTNILKLYEQAGFTGLSFNTIIKKLNLPKTVTRQQVKNCIDTLIAKNKLKYVYSRYYCVYCKFEYFLAKCPVIDESGRDIIQKRLMGNLLANIAQEYDITKERIRQIIRRDIDNLYNYHLYSTQTNYFEEDYYRYFYETYAFDKNDAVHWLGISQNTFKYFDIIDVKQGYLKLDLALDDVINLDARFRKKIKNYINRNKILIDGVWVEKNRLELEYALVKKFCVENISFSDFFVKYNEFLENKGIEYDENIYFTKSVSRSREHQLSASRVVLWKHHKKLRYYDIDGHDYSELLDTLRLDSFIDIEISTKKFFNDHPEILKRYDIRDHYELHNLLRKIIPEGSYNNFRCSKTPIIRFGECNTYASILQLLNDTCPINASDLIQIIHKKFGFDKEIITSTYLQEFKPFYDNGVYILDPKIMSSHNAAILKAALTDEFYYIDDIKNIYSNLIEDADIEEVNSFNLQSFGFTVFSTYILKTYPTMEKYCHYLLTREEFLDITVYKKYFASIQTFYTTLSSLKRNLTIVEYEPNKIITSRKLEKDYCISKVIVKNYCESIYNCVGDNEYFSIQSIRQDGFDSTLFKSGFKEHFYSNLLISDSRFSSGNMFGNIIFCKTNKTITTTTFAIFLVKAHGSITVSDLINELVNRYACTIEKPSDITNKLENSEVYYDKIQNKFYSSINFYNNEMNK